MTDKQTIGKLKRKCEIRANDKLINKKSKRSNIGNGLLNDTIGLIEDAAQREKKLTTLLNDLYNYSDFIKETLTDWQFHDITGQANEKIKDFEGLIIDIERVLGIEQ